LRLRVAAIACALVLIPLGGPAVGRAGERLADDRGAPIELRGPAQRIVSLAPHLTEIVYAAGAGAKLVGAVRFSDYPPPARAIARVGDASRIDLERVVALHPDVVLAWESGNQRLDVDRLARFGLKVFVTEPVRLADVSRLIRLVGRLAGTHAQAQPAAQSFDAEIAGLRRRYAARPPVPVFYEIWRRPLLTINGRHMISDVIRLCGGINVFEGAPALTPAVSLEAVIAARPRAIVGGAAGETKEHFAAQWHRHGLEALRGVVYVPVAPDEIQRPGPRIVAGARVICEGLERARRGPS
jgi:iron complex transport system substrate-binding protein